MILHELATNSAKHGALSSEAGALEITGSMIDDRLELVWAETGGPQVDEMPTLDGFGSKMAGQIIDTELGGAISYDWQQSGLVATITTIADRLPE
jgi:two-component sensor histidine kinase